MINIKYRHKHLLVSSCRNLRDALSSIYEYVSCRCLRGWMTTTRAGPEDGQPERPHQAPKFQGPTPVYVQCIYVLWLGLGKTNPIKPISI